MAVTTTNLGVITAYGDAVAAGYTGTKAEWQALMASYATVGQQAVDAKNDAVAAKNTAVSKATEATTAASTATTKANEASASAQSIAQSAAQIQENTDSIDQLMSEFTTTASKEDMLKSFPTDTASGSVASFADGANVPVKSLIVNIDPMQSGSGDPSHDNVRPISGWTGAQVVRTGVNVWDEEWEQGKISENGNNVADSSRIRAKDLISVKPGGTYYIVGARISWVEYDKERNFIRLGNNGSFVGANESFTVSNNAYYIRFFTTASYGGTYNHNISINYPSTDHDYHPFTGNTYSITFPTEAGTVYGGVLDVTNGVLTVDRAFIASYNGETLPSEWISDRDKYVAGTTPTTGAQVCYKLSQAVVYTLTPTEIKSLLGDNNIWADAGNTEVTYRADPNLYIDKRIGTEAPMVATDNIVSGSYFMVGNNLYKATANIASGATISPNVNCTRKSLSEALNELNA